MTWLSGNWHWVVTACAFVLFVVSTALCIAWDEIAPRRARYVSPARAMPWQKKGGRTMNRDDMLRTVRSALACGQGLEADEWDDSDFPEDGCDFDMDSMGMVDFETRLVRELGFTISDDDAIGLLRMTVGEIADWCLRQHRERSENDG